MTTRTYTLADLERSAAAYLTRFDVAATVRACFDAIVFYTDAYSAADVFTIVEDYIGATSEGVDEFGRMTYTVPAKDLFQDTFYIIVTVRS